MGRVGSERGEAAEKQVSRFARNDKTISSESKRAGGACGGGGEYRDPSARKGRGPQDDKAIKVAPKVDKVIYDGRVRRGGRGPQDDTAIRAEGRKIPTSRAKDAREMGHPRKFPPKRVGELGELAFLQKAIRMGFLVSKPWGDSDRYDFIVDWEGQLYRVQVRSTECMQGPRGYAVHASVYVGKKIVGLTKKEIDVLVAYIFPKDAWYVVPVEKFVPRKNLWFYPDGSKKGAKFEKFREAWGWMRGEGARKKRR